MNAKSKPKKSSFQWLMDSETVIRIYESRLWRRSFAFAIATGISFDRELATVIEAANPSGGEAILDLACGPGIYSRPLAKMLPGGHVVGLDISAPMLNHARLRAKREGVGNLSFIRGSALDLPFLDARFDVVNCCGAIYLFPDVARALQEIVRVLKPGGRFTASALKRSPSYNSDGKGRLSSDEFETVVERAGLKDTKRHFSNGRWTIVSATK